MTLTNKQARFVEEYLRDFNATQAAIRVGYSEKTAYSQGSRLLKNVEVAEVIKSKIMTADEVLSRTADMARADLADLMDITPSGFVIKLMSKDENGDEVINPNTKLIKKIKQKVTTILGKKESDDDKEIIETEIELYNAQEALVTLGKYHKLFTDRTELTGAEGGQVVLKVVYDKKPDA